MLQSYGSKNSLALEIYMVFTTVVCFDCFTLSQTGVGFSTLFIVLCVWHFLCLLSQVLWCPLDLHWIISLVGMIFSVYPALCLQEWYRARLVLFRGLWLSNIVIIITCIIIINYISNASKVVLKCESEARIVSHQVKMHWMFQSQILENQALSWLECDK